MLNYPKTTAVKALCVCEVQDPSKSGVVVSNEVQFFVEKPSSMSELLSSDPTSLLVRTAVLKQALDWLTQL